MRTCTWNRTPATVPVVDEFHTPPLGHVLSGPVLRWPRGPGREADVLSCIHCCFLRVCVCHPQVAGFKGLPMLTSAGAVTADSLADGNIS